MVASIRNNGTLVVAVMDDGFDTDNPHLRPHLWKNPKEVPGNGKDDDGNGYYDDVFGATISPAQGTHGTLVAGVIAGAESACGARAPWTAAGAVQLMPITGVTVDMPLLLERFEKAVDYVVSEKRRGANVRIVNASFGMEENDPVKQARWYAAVKKLADADILLLCAVDNDMAVNFDDIADYPSAARLPNIVTVAWGYGKYLNSSHGPKSIDIAAPSVHCSVAGDIGGTSGATPHVSAYIARLWTAHPDWNAVRMKAELLKAADHFPELDALVRNGKSLPVTPPEIHWPRQLLDTLRSIIQVLTRPIGSL